MKWLKRIAMALGALLLLVVLGLFAASHRKGACVNEATIDIDRPPPALFPWISEPDLLPKWVSGLREVEREGDGGLRVGAKSHEVMMLPDGRYDLDSEVTEFAVNKSFGVRIVGPMFSLDVRYELLPIDAKRTRLHYVARASYKSILLRLMEPFVTPDAQKKLEGDLAGLKTILER